MKRFLGPVLAALLLVACDHHKPANQAQAEAGSASVVQEDSDLTGLPTQPANSPTKAPYPRAQLVSLPVAAPAGAPAAAPPTNPTPDASSIAANSPPPAATTSAQPTSPPESSPPESSPPPAPAPAPVTSGTESSKSPSTTSPSNSEVAATSTASTEDPGDQEQVVVLKTSLGSMVIELDDASAPNTCDNFRRLVSDGFYNHTVFHRVIPNFVIQGGDPNSIASDRASFGNGGPNYKLPAEIKLKHDVGAVAMARLPDSINPQRESNGSQFYICLVACPSLDDKYTVFGHVIKGLDVAEKIASQPRDSRDNPISRIEMEASLESKAKALASYASNP